MKILIIVLIVIEVILFALVSFIVIREASERARYIREAAQKEYNRIKEAYLNGELTRV